MRLFVYFFAIVLFAFQYIILNYAVLYCIVSCYSATFDSIMLYHMAYMVLDDKV